MTSTNNLKPPGIVRIRIDYVDGSSDVIETLPDTNTEIPLYGWSRISRGVICPFIAKTAPAIAALLFQTALARCLTEYDIADPKTRKLIHDHASGDVGPD